MQPFAVTQLLTIMNCPASHCSLAGGEGSGVAVACVTSWAVMEPLFVGEVEVAALHAPAALGTAGVADAL